MSRSNPPKISAGILGYRALDSSRGPELLLVHPGGPFYTRKDEGVWSIPKGELDEGEDPITAALRELREETSWRLPDGAEPRELGTVTLKSGKIIHAFAAPLEVDPSTLVSQPFSMEWPKGSKTIRSFPEVDRAAYFLPTEARIYIHPGQSPLIDRLLSMLGRPIPW